jgi:hypothetical protein
LGSEHASPNTAEGNNESTTAKFLGPSTRRILERRGVGDALLARYTSMGAVFLSLFVSPLPNLRRWEGGGVKKAVPCVERGLASAWPTPVCKNGHDLPVLEENYQ